MKLAYFFLLTKNTINSLSIGLVSQSKSKHGKFTIQFFLQLIKVKHIQIEKVHYGYNHSLIIASL